MDLEDIMVSDISLTGKDKYCMMSLICGKKHKTKTKQKLRKRDQGCGYQMQRVGGEGRGNWKNMVKMYKVQLYDK